MFPSCRSYLSFVTDDVYYSNLSYFPPFLLPLGLFPILVMLLSRFLSFFSSPILRPSQLVNDPIISYPYVAQVVIPAHNI